MGESHIGVQTPYRYGWARWGDVNAFFGLMLDNLAVMIILVTALVGTRLFTADFVLARMIPGTALGVLIGDLVYTWMAFRLARPGEAVRAASFAVSRSVSVVLLI